jgi:hypothetical protein
MRTATALKIAVSASEPPAASTQARQLEPEPGERHDRDDDPGRRRGRRDREHAAGAGHERSPRLARAHPVAPVEERHQEREHGRVEHGAERRHPDREQHDDRDQRREVVAPAGEQLPEARRLERQAAHPEAPRVGLDRQQHAEVVEDRRHDRVEEHLEVALLQELGDDERGGAERRRRQDRADAGGGEHAAARVLRIAGLAQERPRHRAERHRGRHARARHRAEQEPGQRGRATRPGPAAPERRVGELHEEPRRARVLEHGAVEGEQDDVRRRDVERDTEEPLEAHVGHPHEAVDAVALVRDPERVGDQPAEVCVGQKGEADRGQVRRWTSPP